MRVSQTRQGRQPSQRQLRVGEAIRHRLAELLQRGDIHAPELEGISVTVSEVRMSPDLRTAVVYVSRLGGEAGDELVALLNRVQPALRHHVAQAVRLKFAPRLAFRLDTSFDEAARIDRLLHDPRVAADLVTRDGEAARDDEAPGPEDDA